MEGSLLFDIDSSTHFSNLLVGLEAVFFSLDIQSARKAVEEKYSLALFLPPSFSSSFLSPFLFLSLDLLLSSLTSSLIFVLPPSPHLPSHSFFLSFSLSLL